MVEFAAVEGSGDTRVLVLHGWFLDSSVWLRTRALTDLGRFTYAYLDFPGYGTNHGKDPATGIDGMATAALDAADALGWDRFAILGHSMGGATALKVASQAPDRVTAVAALTPASPAGTVLDPDTYRVFEDAWNGQAQIIKAALSPQMSDLDADNLQQRSSSTMDEVTWKAYLRNWTSADFVSDLRKVEAPTEFLIGDSDLFVTEDYIRFSKESVSDSSLITITGAGHYPMIESPEQTVQLSERALMRARSVSAR